MAGWPALLPVRRSRRRGDRPGRGLPLKRTVGVEEEFLLVSAATGSLTPAAPDLLNDPRAAGRLAHELQREQVELNSDPFATMDALAADIAGRRQELAALAASHGVIACASGTAPYEATPTVMPGERFARIADEYGRMATFQLTCGQHVHVSVGSPEEGIGVLDRIRGWLSVLTALAVNSPFWRGADSGYASYRMVVLSELPQAGPAPVWGSAAAYHRATDQMIATGASFDAAMVYYDARLSATYPTVEIRVTDVSRRVDESVLVAALCRALVDTAARAWADGEPPLDLTAPVLRSASWRAARYGTSERLYDPEHGRLAPAWDVVAHLVAHVGGALDANGDSERVLAALADLRTGGTGAERQRGSWRAGGSLETVLLETALAAQTASV